MTDEQFHLAANWFRGQLIAKTKLPVHMHKDTENRYSYVVTNGANLILGETSIVRIGDDVIPFGFESGFFMLNSFKSIQRQIIARFRQHCEALPK